MVEETDETGMLAVDLGGTRLRVAVFDASAEIISKVVVSTDGDDPEQLTRVILEANSSSPVALAGAVIGVPGVVSYRDGRISKMPNLPRWQDEISGDAISQALGLPVMLANDADLGALGEHRFGAGQGVADMVYVTSSTGVGAGVVIGGQLLRGHWSLAEVGHMVIDRNTGETVEQLGSGTALQRLTGDPGEKTTKAAEAGDAAALAAVQATAEALAIGVHNLVHCFMPERVVLGGGFALGAGDFVLAPLREKLSRCDKGCQVRGDDVTLAAGGDDVGLQGAFALGKDAFGSGQAT